MITYTVNVGCDGSCGATWQSSPMEYPHVTNAVSQAAANGWTREFMKFFCPECSAQRQAAAERVEEKVIQRCIEIVRYEQKASAELLRFNFTPFQLSHRQAAKIMVELERRKIIGPMRGSRREMLVK